MSVSALTQAIEGVRPLFALDASQGFRELARPGSWVPSTNNLLVNAPAGRAFSPNGSGLAYSTAPTLASGSSFTLVVTLAKPAFSGSNPGVWRTGSGGGATFTIFQGTTGLPWIRVNGADVLRPVSGPAIAAGIPVTVVFRVRSGSSAAVFWDGVLRHSATHSSTTEAMSFDEFGWQNLTSEAIGPFTSVVCYPAALSDGACRALSRGRAGPFSVGRTLNSLVAAATGGAVGSAAIAESSDAIAASGNIVILSSAAITDAMDSVSGAGVVPIIGAAAISETADTATGAGGIVVIGSAAITESADTVAAVGVATVGATAAITESRDAVSANGSAGSASASAATTEGADSAHAVGIGGQESAIGAAGRDIYARWAKERRKLEKELREASEADIQELVEELEPVAPPKAKATLATLAEKAQAARTVEARAQFQRAKAQYAKELARLVVSAREADEAKKRQEEDEDNWLFMLMHAA